MDVVTGTIFEANNDGARPETELNGPYPQWEGRLIATASGTVDADGLLATVILDTAEFSVGQSWDLIISMTANGTGTTLNDAEPGPPDVIPLSITDGTTNLVPEPAVFVQLPTLAAVAVPLWLRRRKSTRCAR